MAKKLPCQILTFDENGASQTHTHSPFHKPSKAHARTHSHAQDLSSSLKIAGRHICNFQPVSLESSHSGLSVHECKPRHPKVGLFCTPSCTHPASTWMFLAERVSLFYLQECACVRVCVCECVRVHARECG